LSDEKLLRRFLKDMSAVMDERHLSDTQKLVLLSGDRALIEAAFAAENPHNAYSGFVRAPVAPKTGPQTAGSGFVRASDLIKAVDRVQSGS
jgi:hypothetical protein